MEPKERKDHFILNSIDLGAKIKIKFDIWNDRMTDYTPRSLEEREDWHPDFQDIVATVTELAAAKSLIDINHKSIRSVRAKKLKFDGLHCKADLIIYTINALDPFTVKTQQFTVDAETKKQITREAEEYTLREKRKQGDLFDMGDAILKNVQNILENQKAGQSELEPA